MEKEDNQKKNINWTAAGVIVALFIGLMGILFSYLELNFIEGTLTQSQVSLDILANKEGVYLEPLIVIDAVMYKKNETASPRIFISNNGKIEAINVVVQIIRRQFDGENFTGATWGGDGSFVFDEIKTYETKEIVLPDEYVVNPTFNTMEVRIYYMREYDKQTYSFRTFYFYGPENQNFKSWYNIKQAKKIEGQPFVAIIKKSLELSSELYDKDFKNFLGTDLYKF